MLSELMEILWLEKRERRETILLGGRGRELDNRVLAGERESLGMRVLPSPHPRKTIGYGLEMVSGFN